MTKQTKTMEKQYCVYIMTNLTNQVLYTGVTNNLKRRVYEHKNRLVNVVLGLHRDGVAMTIY